MPMRTKIYRNAIETLKQELQQGPGYFQNQKDRAEFHALYLLIKTLLLIAEIMLSERRGG